MTPYELKHVIREQRQFDSSNSVKSNIDLSIREIGWRTFSVVPNPRNKNFTVRTFIVQELELS